MQTSLNIIPISDWFPGLKQTPVIIAGPCSAESEKQVIQTALEISKIPLVKIFRTGIWKPRTRPNNFEGVGKVALQWLRRVKEETRLLTIIEVATPNHVEECLKNDGVVDMIWIGARTTANPFSVQEIANSLQGIDIPVMIKNPVNPELALWIGALERINKVGIMRLAAIHRGFSPFEKTQLRNIPKWEIPIELKSLFPNLSIINDPSHISGNAEYVASVAQKAMNLNMDGLMIETHIKPSKALSDAKQQITPFQLKRLIEELVFRSFTSDNIDFNNLLEQYREQIDSLDYQILDLLAKRMKIIEKIGYYKNENNVSIIQLRRWNDIIKTRSDFGENLGLDKEFVMELLQLVHKRSIERQFEITDNSKKQ